MTEVQIGLSGLGVLLFVIALRVPIGIALIGVSFGGIWILMGWRVAWGALGLLPYQFAANWVLSSVPMFLLLGFICYHAQLTEGLFRTARLWLERLPGGLAIAGVLGSAGFASVCGSSIACSATMGRIAIPEMMKARYDAELATGSVAVAGTIGALIPPSIILILYGIISGAPITHLFLGGISAGLLTALGYIAVIAIRVRINPALAPQVDIRTPLAEKVLALRETWPVIVIMIAVFAGLFGGVFTPTEAGAVGAFCSTVVGVLKGTLNWSRFKDAILDTVLTTSTLIIIGVGATLLTRFLALSGAGDFLSTAVLEFTTDPAIIMFGIVLVYLFLGLFLEPIGAMLLTLPIVLPIVSGGGFNLVWFGVILTKLLEIGMITPPVGMNVFVIKSVVGNLVSTTAIFRGIFWFLIMDLAVLAILMLVPSLILYLPSTFG